MKSHLQVLHTSHSTLDRTCSDSVVSLRYRKSTSDLTDEPPAAESNTPVVTTHKRRGSSKVRENEIKGWMDDDIKDLIQKIAFS